MRLYIYIFTSCLNSQDKLKVIVYVFLQVSYHKLQELLWFFHIFVLNRLVVFSDIFHGHRVVNCDPFWSYILNGRQFEHFSFQLLKTFSELCWLIHLCYLLHRDRHCLVQYNGLDWVNHTYVQMLSTIRTYKAKIGIDNFLREEQLWMIYSSS